MPRKVKLPLKKSHRPVVRKIKVKPGEVAHIVGPRGKPLAIIPAERVDMVKVVAPIPEQGFWDWLIHGPRGP